MENLNEHYVRINNEWMLWDDYAEYCQMMVEHDMLFELEM